MQEGLQGIQTFIEFMNYGMQRSLLSDILIEQNVTLIFWFKMHKTLFKTLFHACRLYVYMQVNKKIWCTPIR